MSWADQITNLRNAPDTSFYKEKKIGPLISIRHESNLVKAQDSIEALIELAKDKENKINKKAQNALLAIDELLKDNPPESWVTGIEIPWTTSAKIANAVESIPYRVMRDHDMIRKLGKTMLYHSQGVTVEDR